MTPTTPHPLTASVQARHGHGELTLPPDRSSHWLYPDGKFSPDVVDHIESMNHAVKHSGGEGVTEMPHFLKTTGLVRVGSQGDGYRVHLASAPTPEQYRQLAVMASDARKMGHSFHAQIATDHPHGAYADNWRDFQRHLQTWHGVQKAFVFLRGDLRKSRAHWRAGR